jgi:hypothetical protein
MKGCSKHEGTVTNPHNGWKGADARKDPPDWASCTLSGHSTSTCRCVGPLATPPMLPTKSHDVTHHHASQSLLSAAKLPCVVVSR